MVTRADAATELLARRRARADLLAMTTYTMPTYQVSWHHQAINRQLMRLVRGETKRLMLFSPPRHGKSELASRRLPAMVLGNNPASHVISCSYSSGLSERMSRDVQRILGSPSYQRLFPRTRLGSGKREDNGTTWQRTNEIFETAGEGGSYRATGVGGGITGMGFDFGIIDDPVKNQEEADSPTIREKIWEWYTSTFWTRQAPDARILLIMTRWHVDDLAGRLIRQMQDDPDADQWDIVNLPAVSSGRATSPDDVRNEGEALWPDRYGSKFMVTARATLGSAGFEAMYQGNPTDQGGNHFKEIWFAPQSWDWVNVQQYRDAYRIVRPDGSATLYYLHQCQRFVIVDPAASEKQAADYTAIGTFAVTPTNELLMLDMVRERLGIDRIVPRVFEVCQQWRPDWVGMEANGFQVAVARQAQQTPGIPAVRELSHEGKGKLVRATPAIIRAENHQIYMPQSRDQNPWVKTLLDELVTVKLDGKDPHDDQADVLAYAVIGMGTGGVPQMIDNTSKSERRR